MSRDHEVNDNLPKIASSDNLQNAFEIDISQVTLSFPSMSGYRLFILFLDGLVLLIHFPIRPVLIRPEG